MSGGGLKTLRVPKVWGRSDLPAPFDGPESEPIGEIWFEPPPALDAILAKYLFTSEKLSVQVHPFAAASPTGCGKEECWLVVDAEPGASLAAGFREEIDAEAMRAAALDGSIEQLLAWHEVSAGDFLYIPAGTVHAIGPGLTLVEMQQNSPITFRLYDYGRPRELHLDEAIGVATGAPHDPALRRRIDPAEETMLVDGPHFRFAQLSGTPGTTMRRRFSGAVQLLPLAGSVSIGDLRIDAGNSGWATQLDDVDFSQSLRCLIAAAAD